MAALALWRKQQPWFLVSAPYFPPSLIILSWKRTNHSARPHSQNEQIAHLRKREREKKCFPFENSCVLFVHSLISIVQRYESQRTGSGWSFCVRTDSNKLRVTDSVSQTAQKHSSLWHGWNLTFSCWLRLSRQKRRQHEILSGQLGTSSRSSICFFFYALWKNWVNKCQN